LLSNIISDEMNKEQTLEWLKKSGFQQYVPAFQGSFIQNA